ncbi:MAG: flagellar FliJ family protein [Candidatus Eisenbacteria sp.]|nr:flagellar FliJ family protein [Candidatus Eisenbacteria bacterium]
MKRFRFALQGLEKVRQVRLDDARLALARTEAKRRAEEERIMRLEQKMDETSVASAREGTLDITGLLEEQRYIGELRRQRQGAIERLSQWIGAVEKDRQELLRVSKEHKALERLRERRYLEFVREVMREETQQSDETASICDQRRRMEA